MAARAFLGELVQPPRVSLGIEAGELGESLEHEVPSNLLHDREPAVQLSSNRADRRLPRREHDDRLAGRPPPVQHDLGNRPEVSGRAAVSDSEGRVELMERDLPPSNELGSQVEEPCSECLVVPYPSPRDRKSVG